MLVDDQRSMHQARTYRCSSANLFAFAAEPLPFGYEGNTIAFLVNSKITPITEDDGIRILTITIVADGALGIRLVSRRCWLAIHGSRRTGSWPVRLRVPWIWLGNS